MKQKPVIVLVTTGKHDSVYAAKVKLFVDDESARNYCSDMSTGKKKYWTLAQIVGDGEEVELSQPEQE